VRCEFDPADVGSGSMPRWPNLEIVSALEGLWTMPCRLA